MIVSGKVDHIAEQAFFNVGSMEDVEKHVRVGNDTECRPQEQRWVLATGAPVAGLQTAERYAVRHRR